MLHQSAALNTCLVCVWSGERGAHGWVAAVGLSWPWQRPVLRGDHHGPYHLLLRSHRRVRQPPRRCAVLPSVPLAGLCHSSPTLRRLVVVVGGRVVPVPHALQKGGAGRGAGRQGPGRQVRGGGRWPAAAPPLSCLRDILDVLRLLLMGGGSGGSLSWNDKFVVKPVLTRQAVLKLLLMDEAPSRQEAKRATSLSDRALPCSDSEAALVCLLPSFLPAGRGVVQGTRWWRRRACRSSRCSTSARTSSGCPWSRPSRPGG